MLATLVTSASVHVTKCCASTEGLNNVVCFTLNLIPNKVYTIHVSSTYTIFLRDKIQK